MGFNDYFYYIGNIVLILCMELDIMWIVEMYNRYIKWKL